MGQSVVHGHHRIEAAFADFAQRGHVGNTKWNRQTPQPGFPPRTKNSRFAQVRPDHLMSHSGEPDRLCADPTGAIENPERIPVAVRGQKSVQQ